MGVVIVSLFGAKLRNINILKYVLIANRSAYLTCSFSNISPRPNIYPWKKTFVFYKREYQLQYFNSFYRRDKLSLALQKNCLAGVSTSSCREMNFTEAKEKYLNLSLEEKRSQYHCKSKYVTLDQIYTWKENSLNAQSSQSSSGYQKNERLNEKVSIFVGDITALEIDAIVNAANTSLRGGGGVDGAIHMAAGKSLLLAECSTLNGCETGQAKITGGYKLPAKYIIHTVGPVGEKSKLLTDCYMNSLTVAQENGVRTVAFPCISTGVYGYPNKSAAHVALKAVRSFLEKDELAIDRVIFCLFLPVDVEIYEELIKEYFPV